MNATREEAAQALKDVELAGEKIGRLQGYRHGAPFFIVWGLVWLCANTATHFLDGAVRWAWPVGVAVGVAVSLALSLTMTRKRKVGEPRTASDQWIGQRIGLTSFVYFGFFACLVLIVQPDSARQGNAMVSIFFPFTYMAAGLWAGWRLFAIGAVTAAAIMFGYFYIGDWFDLWMGVVGGGSLILGGLWLRTA